jgi:hypothetical protein
MTGMPMDRGTPDADRHGIPQHASDLIRAEVPGVCHERSRSCCIERYLMDIAHFVRFVYSCLLPVCLPCFCPFGRYKHEPLTQWP